MTQADRVHSTPPTNAPIDTTRRRILTLAAGSAVAAAIPTTAPQATAPVLDPIFAAIDGHRRAYAAMQAVFAEHRRAHDLADAMVGSFEIEVPSMVEPGQTVLASCWSDIERAIPSEKHPDLNQHYCDLLEERRDARARILEPLIGDEDDATDEVASPEFYALRRFAQTVPTTVHGLMTMIAYAGEVKEQNADAFDESFPILENMATAASALVGEQSS